TIGGVIMDMTADGTNIFLAGVFSSVGGLNIPNLAKVSLVGTGRADPQWNPGADGFGASLIALNGSDIYVVGGFDHIPGLAKLTTRGAGTVDPLWNPKPNGAITDLALDGLDLYVAGKFGFIGGQPRRTVAKISAVGTGEADPGWDPNPDGSVVHALAHNGRDLYVGGDFTSIGGAKRYGFAFLPVADAPNIIQ